MKASKLFKRILAAALVVLMVFATTACSSTDSSTTSGDTQTTAERHKIGMIWYGNTDAMGGTFYAWANHAAELLNVELVWALGSYDTAAELTDCENLINSGCEGIYFIPMDTAANLQLGNACKDAGVYWAISNRDIIDDDVLAACQANEYFVTRIYDNSYDVCKEMVKEMADAGITKVGMIAGDPTDAMMVDRNNGFIDGCAEYGVEILATFQNQSGNATAVTDGISNFLTLYPEMQGILSVSCTAGTGEAIISSLENSGKQPGEIKVAAFDTFDGNQAAFDAGWLQVSCGGYTTECLVSFLSLVNKLQGNSASDSLMEMTLSPLLITSSEDMEIFSQYVDNPDVQLYSDELIQSLVGADVTEADYQKVLDDWSIDFVKEAVGLS